MPYEKTAHELSQPPPPPTAATEVSLLFKGWDTGLLRVIANLFYQVCLTIFFPPFILLVGGEKGTVRVTSTRIRHIGLGMP